MRIIVYHDSYGCETGCCGHTVELTDDQGKVLKSQFLFAHPNWWTNNPKTPEAELTFAKECIEEAFGKDHCQDLDWDNCSISDS